MLKEMSKASTSGRTSSKTMQPNLTTSRQHSRSPASFVQTPRKPRRKQTTQVVEEVLQQDGAETLAAAQVLTKLDAVADKLKEGAEPTTVKARAHASRTAV